MSANQPGDESTLLDVDISATSLSQISPSAILHPTNPPSQSPPTETLGMTALPVDSVSTGIKRKRSDSTISPWHDTIVLVVGPANKEFTVHAHFLRRVPFFRACLDNPMKEAIERVIELPEDKPKVVQEMIHWLYYGTLEHDYCSVAEKAKAFAASSPEREHSRAVEHVMVCLWIFAKKCMVEELQNLVVDSLRAGMLHTTIAKKSLEIIIEQCEHEDPLRKLALQSLSRNIGRYKDYEEFLEKSKGVYLEWAAQGATERWKWIIEAQMSYPKAKNPAKDSDGCKWHVHVDSEKCVKAETPI